MFGGVVGATSFPAPTQILATAVFQFNSPELSNWNVSAESNGPRRSCERVGTKYHTAPFHPTKFSTVVCRHGYCRATPLPSPMHFYPTSLRESYSSGKRLGRKVLRGCLPLDMTAGRGASKGLAGSAATLTSNVAQLSQCADEKPPATLGSLGVCLFFWGGNFGGFSECWSLSSVLAPQFLWKNIAAQSLVLPHRSLRAHCSVEERCFSEYWSAGWSPSGKS